MNSTSLICVFSRERRTRRTNTVGQTRDGERSRREKAYLLTVRPIVWVECQRRSVAKTLGVGSHREERCRHRRSGPQKCLLICLHDVRLSKMEIYESIDSPAILSWIHRKGKGVPLTRLCKEMNTPNESFIPSPAERKRSSMSKDRSMRTQTGRGCG